jgi:transposase
MLVTDGKGTPLGLHVDSASPGEITLLDAVLDDVRVPRTRLPRLIGDRAYDSDPMRKDLARRGTRLIAPHRKSRTKAKRQDGRPMRRYSRRWIIERTFSWLQRFRRLVVRYEYYALMFCAFLHVAFILLSLRRL